VTSFAHLLDPFLAIVQPMNPAEKTHKQTSQRDLERIRERYNVTLDHTVPVPEARERLWLYDSEKWIKKMRKARHTQNRREERELSILERKRGANR
jgi:hypothetical protein